MQLNGYFCNPEIVFYPEGVVKDFLLPAVVLHSSIVVNLFCYSFLSVKEKNNLTFTAYQFSSIQSQQFPENIWLQKKE
jgi:hypothetical protein